MTNINEKQDGRAKRFFKKLLKIVVNNWPYKLLAAVTALIVWLTVPFIY